MGREQRANHATPEGVLTFGQFLETMFAQKHTGPVTLHFAEGYPLKVDIPSDPRRICLTRAADRVGLTG